MEKYYRIVIDLYKQAFVNYKCNQPVDTDAIIEAQKCIDYAIDHATIHNEPLVELEALKEDLNKLKYEIL